MPLIAIGLAVAGCDSVAEGGIGSDGPTIAFDSTDVQILGTSESLADVRDMEVLADGTVWVLNSVEPLFIGFGPGGRVFAEHGRLGGGPREFGQPAGFVRGEHGSVAWVFDAQRHAVIEVSGDESGSTVVRIPADQVEPGRVTGSNPFLALVESVRVGDELFLPVRSGALEIGALDYWWAILTADLVAMELTTGRARTVVALADVLGDPRGRVEVEGAALPFPFWSRLWSVCGGDELQVYDRLRNQVRRFTLDGVELDPDSLPAWEQARVTPRKFARATLEIAAVEQMGAVPSGGLELTPADSATLTSGIMSRMDADPGQLADVLPRYVDFDCDSEGTRWMQPFDIETPGPMMRGFKGGRIWLRTARAEETQQVRLPGGFEPHGFTAERIWGVQRDALGVASLAWIGLEAL